MPSGRAYPCAGHSTREPSMRTLLCLILGVATWWLSGQLLAFTGAITITAFLASITVVQRIAHVSRQGDRSN